MEWLREGRNDYGMDKKYFTQLTSRLYRLTLFFPQGDPLKLEMRRLGTTVLSNLIFILEGSLYKSQDIIDDTKRDVETLDSFFEVVKNLNWINSPDLLEIKKEYSKIGEELNRISEIQSIEAEEIPTLQLEPEKKKESKKEEEQEDEIEGEEEGIELSELKNKETIKKKSKTREKIPEKVPSRSELLERQREILRLLQEKDKAQVGDFKEAFSNVSKRTLRRDFRYLTEKGFIERKGERNNTFYEIKNSLKLG